jgi:hypothetical protein
MTMQPSMNLRAIRSVILSSVFFLVSRHAKASIGLTEFDILINKIEQIGKISLEEGENKKLYLKFENE